jgi:hypothetical protein
MDDTSVDAKLPLDDDEWLGLARDAHSGATSFFDTAVRGKILSSLRQFQSQHPQGSKYLSDGYRARSRFFRPKTRASVRKNEAIAAEAYFSNEDVLNVTAGDEDDPQQRASAEILKALLQYRLTKPGSIPWFLTLVGAYQDAMVQGVVCSYQCWEYNKKRKIDRPAVRLRPIENIRFDASADWYDVMGSSPYFIDMIPMYVKDVRARMTTIDAETGQYRWRSASDAQILAASTQYADIVRMQREQGRVDPKVMQSAITQFSMVWVHRNIVEVDGEDYVYHTLGTQLLLDKPRRLSEVWFHGRRPYVIGFPVIETHKTYPSSPVDMTKDVQAELNENANQRSDNVKFAMNKRYFVKRTGNVDLRSLQRNVPSSTTMMNDPADGKDVRVVDTPDVTRSAYEEQDRLNLDFDDLAGSFSQASVQSNRKLNETVGGMEILTKDASQISAYQLRTFNETWAEPVLSQLVLLEQHYETDVVILGLAAQKGKLDRFGVDTITDELLMRSVTVNVSVGVGATNPHDRLKSFVEGLTAVRDLLADRTLERFGLDTAEIFKEVFGMMGYKDGKRFMPDNVDPNILSLQNTVQELQQQLAQKNPPEIVAATVKKLTAEVDRIRAQTVKEGVESAFSAIQTAEVITAVPAVAPVADKVMQGAGYVAPPGGMDPNLPQPPGSGSVTLLPVNNRRTGAQIQPGDASIAQNTHPNMPANPTPPASPEAGAAAGLQTMRAD